MKELLIGLLGSTLLKVLNLTLRWQTVGLSGSDRYWTDGPSRILVFWHAHQLMMPWIYLNSRKTLPTKPMVVLISQHKDGRLVAKAMKFIGIDSFAGSSTRGGREALFGLIDTLKNGSHVSITPDGPKGPARKLKSGVLRVAQRSGALIYPTAIGAQKKWVFKSWDSMFLPKPFSRAVVMMGEAIAVPAKLTAEEIVQLEKKVETALNDLCDQAENFDYRNSQKSLPIKL